MLLARLADASTLLAATPGRTAKIAALAALLADAAPAEVGIAVSYLSGDLPQRRTGLGGAALRDRPAAAAEPTLTVTEVDAAFDAIAAAAGPGSTTWRRSALHDLLARATAPEQRLLAGLVLGELRHGALEGLMLDAVAAAARLPAADVRRAAMLRGALVPVAVAALTRGAEALAEFALQVGRPVQPMLAATAPDLASALDRVRPAILEEKLDGIRVQVHRDGDDVAVFSRSLEELTGRLPEVVEGVRSLPVRSIVLDGETLALGANGRPLPFQVTAGRTARSVDVAAARRTTPVRPFFFDVLHLDGRDLLGEPQSARIAALSAVVPAEAQVGRIVTADDDEAARFLAATVERGHEGVLVKSPDVPYEAGRRGSGWIKVKPRHTLDLVVLAAEWGSGRRTGWLSNLHLGAADGQGGFVMLGKTFKGLTDELLAWQTERLLELAVDRGSWVVTVRPELVVEIAFDGVQASTRYPGGVTLRFARVVRYRPDKSAAEADSLATVRALHAHALGGSVAG